MSHSVLKTFFLAPLFIVNFSWGGELGDGYREGVWANSPVGQCVKSFVYKKRNGADGMVSRQEKFKDKNGARYIWFWDGTPSANPDRLLYRVDRKNTACIILFAPAADDIDFQLSSGRELPESIITKDRISNSEPTITEVVYRRKQKSILYYPSQCFRVDVIGNKRYEFDCNQAFSH